MKAEARGQDALIRRWRLKTMMEEKYVPPDWALELSYIPSTFIQVVVHHCNDAVIHADGKNRGSSRSVIKRGRIQC